MTDRIHDPTTQDLADRAAQLIRRAGPIVAITHTAPDADAIGGLLGLTLALRPTGIDVIPACSDAVPARFKTLPGYDRIVDRVDTLPDLLITLDCGDRERMGPLIALPEWQAIPILNIDHHVTNTRFGSVNWVDVQATATCEIVLTLIDDLRIPLTSDIAVNLLYGIVGDTLGFRTPHTTPHAMECAMRLMSAGANLSEIMDNLFNRRPLAMISLWALALGAMRIEPAVASDRARVIWTKISGAARRAAGAAELGNNGLSSFLVSADEADVAAVIAEQDDGKIEISLRGKPGFDVSQAAMLLGGGGHAPAAGATIPGPLDAAVQHVLAVLKSIRRSD